MSDVLVLFTGRRTSRRIAEAVASVLRARGHNAIAVRPRGHLPPAADFDAVVIGTSTLLGRHPVELVVYVTTNLESLVEMPTAYFAVGRIRAEPFFAAVGWHPRDAVLVESATDWPAITALAERVEAALRDDAASWSSAGAQARYVSERWSEFTGP